MTADLAASLIDVHYGASLGPAVARPPRRPFSGLFRKAEKTARCRELEEHG